MLLYDQITHLNKEIVEKTMKTLLKEDIPKGDSTTEIVIKNNETGRYVFRAREEMVFCGGTIIQNTFSKKVEVEILVQEGDNISSNTDIAIIKGSKQERL